MNVIQRLRHHRASGKTTLGWLKSFVRGWNQIEPKAEENELQHWWEQQDQDDQWIEDQSGEEHA